MINPFRLLLLSGVLVISSAYLCACSSSGASAEKNLVSSETEYLFSSGKDLFGGGMVCNTTLLSTGEDEYFSYELPVISPEELKNITLENIQVSGEGDYRVEWDHVSSGGVYKGWYYYYIHLKVSASKKTPASFSIEDLKLNIDGTSYRYVPESLVFYNIEGLYGEDIPDDSGILLYKEAPEAILSVIPSDPSSPLTISLEVNKDCTLTGFSALDHLDITDIVCKVNDAACENFSMEEGLPLHKGDSLEISFCLQYKEGVSKSSLVKTSRILQYTTDKDGQKYLLNDPQGFILIGFENDEMIKNYIDCEILGNE